MAYFVVVINEVPVAAFDKIMTLVSGCGEEVKFIPHERNAHNVNTSGMSGPDPRGEYHTVRLEFTHNAVDKAAEILIWIYRQVTRDLLPT